MQEPLRFNGALIRRRFEYLFPVNEDGKEIGFDDREAWQSELEKAVGKIQVKSSTVGVHTFWCFIIDLENCGLTNKEVNERVTNITTKHLLIDCAGVFWGTVSNDNWKTYRP